MLPGINKLLYISLDFGESYPYKARVADISKEALSIELPVEEGTGSVKVLPEGSIIHITYNSGDSGQISFKSKVVRLLRERIPLLLIEIPDNYQRIQRRDYLRVPTSVEMAINLDKNGDKEWYVVQAIDISGGGMQFTITIGINLEAKQRVEGWIVVPYANGVIDHIKFQGEVVRVDTVKDKTTQRVSIKFIDIQELTREKIIRYAYEKQVAIKKRIK